MFFKNNPSNISMKSILTHNVYTKNTYVFKDDSFEPSSKRSYDTTNFICSYINHKDIIITRVKISRNIEDEDIEDVLEIKAYEELGLDPANHYIIQSSQIESTAQEKEYYLFIVKDERVKSLYSPLKEETKYIDLIIPAPLLYGTLYERDILDEEYTHCFVYFTPEDTYITLYKQGKYLYSKSIEYSLKQMHDRYCEYMGEKIEEEAFLAIFQTQFLSIAKNENEVMLEKIFSEIFSTLNDIIIYVKRAFNLHSIDQIYLGTQKGSIVGLEAYSQQQLGITSRDFQFDYKIHSNQTVVDYLHYLMLLSTLEYMEGERSFINFSIYPRAPAFVNRASGQFIISIFLVISLSLAYPLIYLIGSYVNNAKIFALKIEDEKLREESKKYHNILNQKKTSIEKLDKQIKLLSTTYNAKTKTLTAIYNKKINYKLKSGLFHSIADDLEKFDVHIEHLSSENDTLFIALVSRDDRKFTELIKYISDKYFDDVKEIDIDEILKDSKNSYYKGLLKVVR